MGQLKLTLFALFRTGKGAAFIAEQLAFEQAFWKGCAVDLDERLPQAWRFLVQVLGNHLLAHAAFPKNDRVQPGVGHMFNQFSNPLDVFY